MAQRNNENRIIVMCYFSDNSIISNSHLIFFSSYKPLKKTSGIL